MVFGGSEIQIDVDGPYFVRKARQSKAMQVVWLSWHYITRGNRYCTSHSTVQCSPVLYRMRKKKNCSRVCALRSMLAVVCCTSVIGMQSIPDMMCRFYK